MSSNQDQLEINPDHWWLYRTTDDDHLIFAYEYSAAVLCHVQRTTDWLVRIDRADGEILFSRHGLRSRDAALELAESVMNLCSVLHREVVTERSQLQHPVYVGTRHEGTPVVSRVQSHIHLPLDRSQELVNHSPSGIEWGYRGSGPAQLALALLLDYTGDQDLALQHYMPFKDAVVSRLTCDEPYGAWMLTGADIERSLPGPREGVHHG